MRLVVVIVGSNVMLIKERTEEGKEREIVYSETRIMSEESALTRLHVTLKTLRDSVCSPT